MSPRIAIAVVVIILALTLSGCGGGSSSTGGGGGGGGGGQNPISISVLSPSSVMVGIPFYFINVYGQGIVDGIVLIDGQPVTTIQEPGGVLEAEVDLSFDQTAGTHQFSVQRGGQVTNTLPFTVYAPQQGPFVMQATPSFLVGEGLGGPPFIVAADVNGDGLADVLMPGTIINGVGSIAILFGQANGTLSAAQYVPVPQTPYALAVGDIDGNGTPDIVSITSDNGVGESSTVSTLLGDGHGNFQAPATQQTVFGIYPGPAYLADLNGDGKPDLVLSVQQSIAGVPVTYSLVWMENTGGGFAAPVTLASAANQYFSVADFDGDGKPDIVYETPATSTTTSSIHILMNQGGGTFIDQAAGGLNGVAGLATVVDFNLDGIPDLIVQVGLNNGGILYSFAGNGNGSFTQVASLNTPGPSNLAVGDFDHDGFPDLAAPAGSGATGILYFFGDGHGHFSMQAVVGPGGQWTAVGDFNGDGIPDVVIPDETNFVSLSLGRKDRSFPSVLALYPATVTYLSIGDINGDGLPDIFSTGNREGGIPGTVFLNQGNSSFTLAAYTDPSAFEIADLTGKGVVDLLGGNNETVEVWPNNLTPNFSSSAITLAQSAPDVTVADMDGDGYPDIVSSSGQILYGKGQYQFTPVNVASQNWGFYVVGDFNGDGKLDIATASGTFLNTGNRTFQEVPTLNNLPLQNGAVVAVGDFNGDGKDDVAMNLPGPSAILIYYSRGDGTFYLGTLIDPGQYPGGLSVGDFNGDGKLDLAVGLMLGNQACIFFNSGNGQFTRTFFASGAFAIGVLTADLNKNGKPDLVIANFVYSSTPPNVNIVFHQ